LDRVWRIQKVRTLRVPDTRAKVAFGGGKEKRLVCYSLVFKADLFLLGKGMEIEGRKITFMALSFQLMHKLN
jgi:hypothetical protein